MLHQPQPMFLDLELKLALKQARCSLERLQTMMTVLTMEPKRLWSRHLTATLNLDKPNLHPEAPTLVRLVRPQPLLLTPIQALLDKTSQPLEVPTLVPLVHPRLLLLVTPIQAPLVQLSQLLVAPIQAPLATLRLLLLTPIQALLVTLSQLQVAPILVLLVMPSQLLLLHMEGRLVQLNPPQVTHTQALLSQPSLLLVVHILDHLVLLNQLLQIRTLAQQQMLHPAIPVHSKIL